MGDKVAVVDSSFAAILPVASGRLRSWNLSYVRFEPGMAIVTDGRVMVVRECESEGEFVVPAGRLSKVLDQLKLVERRPRETIAVQVEPTRISYTDVEEAHSVETPEYPHGQYPEWRSVIPPAEFKGKFFVVNPRLLAKALAACDQPEDAKPVVVLGIPDEATRPMVVFSELDGGETFAVVMPVAINLKQDSTLGGWWKRMRDRIVGVKK